MICMSCCITSIFLKVAFYMVTGNFFVYLLFILFVFCLKLNFIIYCQLLYLVGLQVIFYKISVLFEHTEAQFLAKPEMPIFFNIQIKGSKLPPELNLPDMPMDSRKDML